MKVGHLLCYALLAIYLLIPSLTRADVQITQLTDFNFNPVNAPPTSNPRITRRVCVYNSAGSGYTVTATSSNASPACSSLGGEGFCVASAGNLIRYRVRWRGNTGGFITLDNGSGENFTGATQSLNCAGVPNNQKPRLRILFQTAAFSPFPIAGMYSDLLSILIAPN